jgi:hypothetical protein
MADLDVRQPPGHMGLVRVTHEVAKKEVNSILVKSG